MVRFPYYWEDDSEMYNPERDFSLDNRKYHFDGLKIFNFHPIHIVLNSFNIMNYERCKEENADVSRLRPADIRPYIHDGKGTRTLFMELLEFMANNENSRPKTISELANQWQSRNTGNMHE
jgi:hypothetical protein